jgi:hypothetical protein
MTSRDAFHALHRLGDLREPRLGVVVAHRQRRHHRRDLVAQGAARLVGAHAHRHHRLQLESLHLLATAAQVAAQRAGDRCQHHVVDRPAERVLDRLDVGERQPHPGEAPVRANRRVVRALGRGVHPGPRHRADPGERRDGGARDPPRRAERGAHAAHDLGRDGGALDQRLGQQLCPRRQWARQPALGRLGRRRRVGRGVEQDARDVDPGDPVDQRVVGLRQHREAVAALEPVHDPHLPQRLVAVELL